MRPVPFTVTAAGPTVVQVVAADGRRFQVTLNLAILQIFDAEMPNPHMPGLPVFNFQGTVITTGMQQLP